MTTPILYKSYESVRRAPCGSNNEGSVKGLIKIRENRVHSNHKDRIMMNHIHMYH